MFRTLILLWFSLMIFRTTAVEYRELYCGYNTTNPIINTTYYQNLNQVLDSLASDTSCVKDDMFFTNTSGNKNPDIAYGLYLCRADIIPNDCRNCLLEGSEYIKKTCPFSKEAVLWKDTCMLHYANHSLIFNKSAIFRKSCNRKNISNHAVGKSNFWDEANKFMPQLAIEASNRETRKFAYYNEFNYNGVEKFNGYVECRPDLSVSDCSQCLQESIESLGKYCYGKEGARVLTPSCNARFEMYKFLQFSPAASSSGVKDKPETRKKENSISFISIIPGVFVLITGLCLTFCLLKESHPTNLNILTNKNEDIEIITDKSLQFQLTALETATNNFSTGNKIGEGGFGGVYKGVLPNGQHIAVKRLSKDSGQGAIEFKNEVTLLAKLQHRNLVRLLGFCVEDEETILVYEYVPNKSLDYYLFDPAQQAHLDWSTRYNIIQGTARGMLYLHEDSRLNVIHRDLKAGNILLENDMNPKISDFGTARIFYRNQIQANTQRIVGTYGYMSPEYAMHGYFSIKSDVYSLGVLFLEIISGKRNTSHFVDLLSLAWNKWKNGEPRGIIDPKLMDSISEKEVIHCIHIALLCIQEDSELRPSIASVVHMLNTYSIVLPLPQNPPFESPNRVEFLSSEVLEPIYKSYVRAANDSPITEVRPR